MKIDYRRIESQAMAGTEAVLTWIGASGGKGRRRAGMLVATAACLLGARLGLPAQPAVSPTTTTDYSIIQRGPNHRVWGKVAWETNVLGRVIARTNSYTELACGLNRLDPATGQWVESREIIESLPGYAIARQGQHQVIFANDLATAGAIDMQTPDGKRLTSHVLCLCYFDASTGTNVLIAQVTNCVGRIVPPNQVLYEHAFDTLNASVRYTYTRGGLEQDILILEVPPSPQAYGMNPATTRLVVMTEFINPPQAAVQPSVVTDVAGTPLEDDAVDFGAMQLGQGKGFLLGATATETGLSVFKQWAVVEGRQFLIEQVRAPDLFKAISSLTTKPGASLKSTSQAIRFTASTRQLPSAKAGKRDNKAMELAAGPLPQKGYVLDYITVISTNNLTFQNDNTYYVSGPVTLTGTVTFEGGCVIKFTNSPDANIVCSAFNSSVVCATAPFRMANLSSKDDNSIGLAIGGSNGNPTNYNGATYITLPFYFSVPLKYFRFSYAGTGVSYPGGAVLPLSHCQFVRCATGVFANGPGGPVVNLYNALFAKCGTAVYSTSVGPVLNGQNVTADCDQFSNIALLSIGNSILDCNSYGYFMLINVNSIVLTNVDLGGLFQSVGGASYYLVDGSTNRNAGTTNISSTLLADLRSKTTYPPTVLANITADTILSPQAQRDTGVPDLGYHADPLDYAISGLTITNTLLCRGANKTRGHCAIKTRKVQRGVKCLLCRR